MVATRKRSIPRARNSRIEAASSKMAPGLYLPFCEVPGNVRWSSVNKAPTSIKLTPGKLCLTRLADTFYIQCVFDTGKASKRVKVGLKSKLTLHAFEKSDESASTPN